MGIRAEVSIDPLATCPVARVSAVTGAPCTDIEMTAPGTLDEPVTEEFLLHSDAPPNGDVDGVELSEVFSYGSNHTYRFTRSRAECVCERVERANCPVTDVTARDGQLYLTFHTADMEQLKAVLVEIRDLVDGVRVKQLLNSTAEDTMSDLVLLDRSELTARQREVLETAHDMGYFEHGQGANAGEVAAALGINTSTFSEHLRAAQRKLLRTILER